MDSRSILREWLDADLARLRQDHLFRERTPIERRWPGHVRVAGRDYVDFSSNDYLGLATDPRLRDAVARAADQWGWGAGASALVGGYCELAHQLEIKVAEFEGTESAVVFPSGFSANMAAISSMADAGSVVFSAKRNHASLIDGCRLSRARIEVHEWDDLDLIEERLRIASETRRFIVTDSVFSMDGDIAPLEELNDLAQRHGAVLHVDEAHATGVLGQAGRGAAELFGVESRLPYRMGTLSKALGGIGGFIAGDRSLVAWLVSRARSYIYSTALPPVCAAASLEALCILSLEPDRREILKSRIDHLRSGVAALGWRVPESPTPIVPLITGSADSALALAEHLKSDGFWSVAIRPPTVAAETSRIRVSVSSAHKPTEIDDFLDSLQRFRAGSKVGGTT